MGIRIYTIVAGALAIAACNTSIGLAQKAKIGQRVRVGDAVNSALDESGALISADGKTLFFVRTDLNAKKELDQDIYVASSTSDSTWAPAQKLGGEANNALNNSLAGIGNGVLYLNNEYLPDNRMEPGLSVGTYAAGSVSGIKVVKFETPFPTKGYVSGYVTPDAKVAIVSITPEKGGKEDLYFSEGPGDGTFGELQSLGSKINSEGFETSPFLSADKQTIYFSSDGHGGQGDGDIFSATRKGSSFTEWNAPVNLGPSINTPGFDGFFSIGADSTAYFVSGEGSGGSGDVYTISLKVLKPIAPPAPEVVATPAPPPAPPTPQPDAPAPPPAHEEVEVVEPPSTRKPVYYFAVNSAEVTPETKEKIQVVAKELKKPAQKRKKVEINGFTDETGSEEYNYKLGLRRATAVAAALKKLGIPASRIRTKSYGELNPASTNQADESGKALNRRAEILYSY